MKLMKLEHENNTPLKGQKIRRNMPLNFEGKKLRRKLRKARKK